jgi:pantetheine-phosphate adenylyltransferase
MPRAFYPGSFDPLHNGHVEVIDMASRLFGEVVVTVMLNPAKPAGLFDLAARTAMIEESVGDRAGVTVTSHPGLVVQAWADLGADFAVKGVRSGTDLDVEMQMAHTNAAVSGMPTVFLPTSAAHGFVSSRFIREIAKEGGDVSALVPTPVLRHLAEVFGAPSDRKGTP